MHTHPVFRASCQSQWTFRHCCATYAPQSGSMVNASVIPAVHVTFAHSLARRLDLHTRPHLAGAGAAHLQASHDSCRRPRTMAGVLARGLCRLGHRSGFRWSSTTRVRGGQVELSRLPTSQRSHQVHVLPNIPERDAPRSRLQ